MHNETASFLIVIDLGATASVSFVKGDFVEPLKPSPFSQMKGLTETLNVNGCRAIHWILDDDAGQVTIIKTEAYYVLNMMMQLLSPQAYFCDI